MQENKAKQIVKKWSKALALFRLFCYTTYKYDYAIFGMWKAGVSNGIYQTDDPGSRRFAGGCLCGQRLAP